jgi:hypothetical protein
LSFDTLVDAVILSNGESFLPTEESILLNGVSPINTSLKEWYQQEQKEFLHFINYGTIILPHFYEAMVNIIGKFDYAFCHCAKLKKSSEIISNPVSGNFVNGQFLVKSWVVKELGGEGYVEDLLMRVMAEYRGVEVPHVLAVDVL